MNNRESGVSRSSILVSYKIRINKKSLRKNVILNKIVFHTFLLSISKK